VPGKLSRDVIARAGLRLLDEAGLAGVTMRSVATALGIQAPTLYWHLSSKQELVDAIANIIAADFAQRLRPRSANQPIAHWLAEWARSLRAAILAHRDGARVFAGSYTPAIDQCNELALAEMRGVGFTLELAAKAVLTLFHYTTGSAVEEQARTGIDYDASPYEAGTYDAQLYPLCAQAAPMQFYQDPDAQFEAGLIVVLSGITAVHEMKRFPKAPRRRQ
jgi:TetR/AcrR family tetracycline transcriptional repressor